MSNFGHWNHEVDTRGLPSSMPVTQRGCEAIRQAVRDAQDAGGPVATNVDGKSVIVHSDGSMDQIQ